MLRSADDAARSVGVHRDDAPVAVLGVPVERLLARPRGRRGPERLARRAGCRRAAGHRVVRLVADVGDDACSTPSRYGRRPPPARSRRRHGALALAADPTVPIMSIAHSAPRRRGRRSRTRSRTSPCQNSSLGDIRKPSASRCVWSTTTSPPPPASRPSARTPARMPTTMSTILPAVPLPRAAAQRLRRLRRAAGRRRPAGASFSRRPGRAGTAGTRPSSERVGGDPGHPPVEAEHEVEEPARVARREEQGDAGDEDEQPDQAGLEPEAPARSSPRAAA